MIVAVADRHHRHPGRPRRQHVTAGIADKQRLPSHNTSLLHDPVERSRVGLLHRQGVAANQPAEVAIELFVRQQLRHEATRLVGDQCQWHLLTLQPVKQRAYSRVNRAARVIAGVSLEKQRQRLLGLSLADVRVLDIAGQRPTHQYPRTVADPVTDLLDARGAISVTERQGYILRVRTLARAVAHCYFASRAEKGFPLADEANRADVLAKYLAQKAEQAEKDAKKAEKKAAQEKK